MLLKKAVLLPLFCFAVLAGFAQVKRENLAQTTIGPAEFVLERVITLKTNDTIVSINVSFFDMSKAAKKRVFIGIAIEKNKTTYRKMISNFKEALAFQSTEYVKTWESESYQLESARKVLFKFSQPDKNTQAGHAYTQFTKEQMLSIVSWLESLHL